MRCAVRAGVLWACVLLRCCAVLGGLWPCLDWVSLLGKGREGLVGWLGRGFIYESSCLVSVVAFLPPPPLFSAFPIVLDSSTKQLWSYCVVVVSCRWGFYSVLNPSFALGPPLPLFHLILHHP